MCNAHNLVAYCVELFHDDYDTAYFSFSLSEIKRCTMRMLMYSLAARMILDGEY